MTQIIPCDIIRISEGSRWLIVKGSLGRTKSFEKEATIEKTYPNIFVIKYEEDDRNVTYSYTDILTRTVEVEVFDGVGYSPLIPPYQKEKSKRGRKVQLDNINVQPA